MVSLLLDLLLTCTCIAAAGSLDSSSSRALGVLPAVLPQAIVLAPGATPVESLAAKELARLLQPLMVDNASAVPILPSSTSP